jgi:predicted thioredoxin/glutaredoxin
MKEGCHLCERVIEKLEELNPTGSVRISTRDITQDQELYERYKNLIPVVAINGKVKLAGAVLADPSTLEDVLRKTVFSV